MRKKTFFGEAEALEILTGHPDLIELLNEQLTRGEQKVEFLISMTAEEMRRAYVLEPSRFEPDMISNFDSFRISEVEIRIVYKNGTYYGNVVTYTNP